MRSDDEERQSGRAGDYPGLDENELKMWAWVSAVVSFVVVGGVAVWIFFFNEEADWADRSRTVFPFFTVLAALVTFWTVMYRGAVASRQADEQKRQNDATEAGNRAELFERAVTRLKSEDGTSMRIAVLSLATLIRLPKDELGQMAFDTIGDLMARGASEGQPSQRGQVMAAIRHALEAGAKKGFSHAGRYQFHPYDAKDAQIWQPFPEMPPGTYINMEFYWSDDLLRTEAEFSDCTFFPAGFGRSKAADIDHRFRKCTFNSMDIGSVRLGEGIMGLGAILLGHKHSFVYCSFDEARFYSRNLENYNFKGCGFAEGKPPCWPLNSSDPTAPLRWEPIPAATLEEHGIKPRPAFHSDLPD